METEESEFIIVPFGRLNITVLLCVVLCCCTVSALPFRQRTAFGVVNDFQTQKNPLEIFTGRIKGSNEMDFGVRGKNEMALYRRNSIGYFVKKEFRLHSSSVSVAVSDLNNDGYDDVAFLESSPTQIEIFWGSTRDSLTPTIALQTSKDFEHIMALDINNDGRKDFLLYGKSTLGVGVALQMADGGFKLSTPIFHDLTVNNIIAADVNNDGFTELFIQDWVKNQIQLYIQRGKLKFTPGRVWQFDETPAQFLVQDVNNDGIADLIVSFAEAKSIKVYYGNTYGEFEETTPIYSSTSVTSFALSSLNGESLKNILVLDSVTHALTVFWNDKQDAFQRQLVFAAGKTPVQLAMVPLEGKYEDALVLDKQQSKLFEFVNDKNTIPIEDEQHFATGGSPQGIVTADFSGDGRADLIVANEGSNSLSFFKNIHKEKFGGQFSVLVPENPHSIVLYGEDTTLSLLVSHPQSSMVSKEIIRKSDFSSSYSIISTEPNAVIKWVQRNKQTLLVNFIVEFTPEPSQDSVTLSRVKEISPSQFIEQKIPFLSKEKVFGSLVANIASDGNEDILYASMDNQFHRVSLFLEQGYISLNAQQNSETEFLSPTKVFSLIDSTSTKMLLWNVDINNDKQTDIIGNIDGGTNTLFFSLRGKNSGFLPPVQRLNNIAIPSSELIQFTDYNNDGSTDIVFYNDLTKSLQVCYGRGNGTFLNPKKIFSVSDMGGFVVGRFNNDDIPDIAVTEPDRGVLTIHYGK